MIRNPILARVLLAIGSVALTVLAIDLTTFYLLGMRRLGYGPDRFFQYSSLLGWEHRPYAEGTWYAYKDGTTTHVSINAYGFPDVDRTVAKSRRRIAIIGDSTTEFWEVERAERAQHVMETLLKNQVEVLNFGLRGAGTDQEFIRYTHEVIHFSPDIIVLFFCVNDLDNNVTSDSKPYFVLDSSAPRGISLKGLPVRRPPPVPKSWLRDLPEQSFMLRNLKYLVAGTGTHLRANIPLEDHFELRPFKRTYDAEDERRFELEKRLLAAFASFSHERGIHFLLVEGLYRPALDDAMKRLVVDAYGDQFDFDKISRVLSEHSVDMDYPFLSLPRLVRERGLDVRRLMHPEDTMHLNAEGVKVFSAAVVDKIRELGWIGDAPPLTTDQ